MESHSRKRDKKILNFLSKVAEASDHAGIRARLAAAVVIRNEIISIGFNRRKTHPFQAQFQTNDKQIYLHAETDAINRALKYVSKEDLRKATLYVARVKYKDGKSKKSIWAESMPCIGCQKAISMYGIKSVVHTCSEGYKYM
jgi:tRNA(Arg) A34 adenosine deaminase TadA